MIENPGKEVDQFTLTKNEEFRKSLTAKDNKWVDTKLVEKEGKEYVQLGNPLPGYTGFGKRVLANNIFGKTYAECLKEAKRDDEHLQHEKNRNFQGQLNSDVPLKFWSFIPPSSTHLHDCYYPKELSFLCGLNDIIKSCSRTIINSTKHTLLDNIFNSRMNWNTSRTTRNSISTFRRAKIHSATTKTQSITSIPPPKTKTI